MCNCLINPVLILSGHTKSFGYTYATCAGENPTCTVSLHLRIEISHEYSLHWKFTPTLLKYHNEGVCLSHLFTCTGRGKIYISIIMKCKLFNIMKWRDVDHHTSTGQAMKGPRKSARHQLWTCAGWRTWVSDRCTLVIYKSRGNVQSV